MTDKHMSEARKKQCGGCDLLHEECSCWDEIAKLRKEKADLETKLRGPTYCGTPDTRKCQAVKDLEAENERLRAMLIEKVAREECAYEGDDWHSLLDKWRRQAKSQIEAELSKVVK